MNDSDSSDSPYDIGANTLCRWLFFVLMIVLFVFYARYKRGQEQGVPPPESKFYRPYVSRSY